MRILSVADTHGCLKRLAFIRDRIEALKPDVLAIAGDITAFGNPSDYLDRLNDLALPVLLVRGNTDPPSLEGSLGRYANLTSLHRKKIVLQGRSFVGLGGTLPVPFRSRIGLRERKTMEQAGPLIDGLCVLVAHPPPHGILDEVLGRFHTGSTGLRDIVLARQPRLLLCGHIHERPGMARLGETVVVNCNMVSGCGALVDLQGECAPAVTLL
ncbi:MAG: metallophosphoesterase family protein [Deltaproteobacteria bacterium]|nr:metallophosphoesterase family protein [Deltaproteobacteria bacterium]